MNQEEINILAAEFNLSDSGNEAEMFAKALTLCQTFRKENLKLHSELEEARKENSELIKFLKNRDDVLVVNSNLKTELASKDAKLGKAREALKHCKNRPHEHNPPKEFTITRCEVIDEALALWRDLEKENGQ